MSGKSTVSLNSLIERRTREWMSNRISFIDVLKAIGIFFVFLGHAPGLNNNLKIYIYSFHMPLFFFIAGMFFKSDYITTGFKKYIIKKLRDRLLPYFFFGIITYLVWLAQSSIGVKSEIDPLKPLFGMFYGTSQWLIANNVLWFLACLFITEILFFILRSHFIKQYILIIVTITISILGYIYSFSGFPRLPFCMDISLIAITFYCGGYILKDLMLKDKFNKFVVFILFVSGAFFSYINGRIDMSSNQYENYPFFLIASFSSIIFWFQISKKIPALGVLKYIGKNSILFFLLHNVSVAILYAFIYKILGEQINNPNTLFAVVFSLAGLIILLPVSYFARKYLPSVLMGR